MPLPAEAYALPAVLQRELYRTAGSMLSERLPEDTLHLTLRDLSAGETEEVVAEPMRAVPELIAAARRPGSVWLQPVGIVGMVSASLVLLYRPESEAEHRKLQAAYAPSDAVCPLSYPLPLHCTSAYYRPGSYAPEQWNALLHRARALNSVQAAPLGLELSSLEYQRFFSMKNYHTSF